MNRRQFQQGVLAVLVGACAPVLAQSSKPISLVVGYAPGGSADFVARVVGDELSKEIKRQVIVENAPGASGMLAAQKVLAGGSDGSMIYMGGTDTVVVPMVNPKAKIDWERDFLPMGRMTAFPMVLAVPVKSPYTNLPELLADIRKGKQFNYATPGMGTMQHLYGELIKQKGGVSMEHIPYRGGSQIANDLVGGQIDCAVLVLSTALPFIKDGKIRAISVSDSKRVPQLPDVKRMGEETGFGEVSLPLWQGLFVKSGTPPELLAAYERALQAAMAKPEVQHKLTEAGFTPAFASGKDFREFIRPQAKLYKDIVTTAKITME